MWNLHKLQAIPNGIYQQNSRQCHGWIYQSHHKAQDIWKSFTIISKEYVIFHMIIILNDKKFDDKDCCIGRTNAFCDAHFG